jgi:hypothetical protein
MLAAIQAEHTRQLVNALLVTGGRRVSDEEHRRFIRELDGPSRGRIVRPQKASRGLLTRLGWNLKGR